MLDMIFDSSILINLSFFIVLATIFALAPDMIAEAFSHNASIQKKIIKPIGGCIFYVALFATFNQVVGIVKEDYARKSSVVAKVATDINALEHTEAQTKAECVGDCEELFKENGISQEEAERLANGEEVKDIEGLDNFMEQQ